MLRRALRPTELSTCSLHAAATRCGIEAAITQCRQRSPRPLEWERRRGVWLQLPLLIESEDLRVACGHLRRAPLAIIADLQSTHLDVLQQQVVGFEHRDATGGETDHHQTSAPGERAQCGTKHMPPSGSRMMSAPCPS